MLKLVGINRGTMKTKDSNRKWMWWFLGVIGAMQLYFVRELLAAFALFALGFGVIAFVIGALYLTLVCLIPEFMFYKYNMSFSLGGTSILIVVSVTMDTVAQIQSHLVAQQYEGLLKKSKLRGARR